jgi:hypothetical protein
VSSPSPGLVAVAAVVFVVCLIGLVFFVVKLVVGNRSDVLASAPLTTELQLTLESSGQVVVMIEAPRMSTDYRNFEIQLLDRQSRQVTTLKYSYATAQSSVYGVTTVQVPFGRLEGHAGAYHARVFGPTPGSDYSGHRLILSRPYMGRMVIQIVGIVLCGVGALGSVIWACWLMGWMKTA